MRVVVVYRYFAPDTPPYAIMLDRMTAWLAEDGHQVEVLTAQPAYKPEAKIPQQPWRENRTGVEIRRFWLLRETARGLIRAFNSFLFVVFAAFEILIGPKRDLVWTATMPPVFQAFLLCLASKIRGASFLYQMQDIYPEVAEATGNRLPAPLAWFLRRLDNWTLRNADACVVLSEDMADTIRGRVGNTARLHVINNFALALPAASPPRRPDGPVRFLFAGNIGRYQALPELVNAFASAASNDLELVLLGEGALKEKLIKRTRGQKHIHFLDHVPPEEALRKMQAADFGIVSLTPGLYRYAFPSKLLTYLAASLKILAIIEPESRLAKMILENHLGHTLSWSDKPEKWSRTLLELARTARSGEQMVVPPCLYHPESIRGQWLELVQQLGEKRT